MAFMPSHRVVRRVISLSAADNDFDGFSSKVRLENEHEAMSKMIFSDMCYNFKNSIN
jgi:hypothetical protein